jgi:hypothetical protein
MIHDWKKEIGVACLVKQHVAELDKQGLWPVHLPEVAASQCQVEVAEDTLGE